MKIAIAVQTMKHPERRSDYQVWFLTVNEVGSVVGVGVIGREELVKEALINYQKSGRTNWRAFLKGREESTPVDVFDFIAQNMHENTHFGELPTLSEFQQTLNYLNMSMELRAIA